MKPDQQSRMISEIGWEQILEGGEDMNADAYLDDILARKSGLAFLCKVNADYKEIERYLSIFPEALLFGAEGNSFEEILTKQMKACTCFGKTCNRNRRLILRALGRGFEFYRGIRLVNLVDDNFFSSMDKKMSDAYNIQLRDLERDLRILKLQETLLDSQIALATEEVANLRSLIEQGSRSRQSQMHLHLLKLQCRKAKTHAFEERATVENRFAAATLAISSLEEDRKLLQTEKATTLRLQQAFLKKIFSGARRHICNASKHDL
ncbi:hypothetical protein IV203_036496 [Nitzschia inconspicua]|uniref:Uncharacterized protein n=1 Tax=Nitzschia inconspicua TaxID=303405 RepID=A0A9K3LI61_9STRA|nr:hypothetical protein IV203_036496 [Nitzschia inconspicua]